MAQATAPPSLFFLFSRSAKPSSIATSSPFSRSSLPLPSLQSNKARRRDGGGDAFATNRSYQKLEEEIFEFMRRSKKPGTFPTKDELIEAGRRDLAKAVAAQGGWLAFGWDLGRERKKEKEGLNSGSGFIEEDLGLKDDAKIRTEDQRGVHPDCQVSVSGRSMDDEDSSDNGGLEGILKRIEKQRSLAKTKGGNGQASYNKHDLDPGDGAFVNHKHSIGINGTSDKLNSSIQEQTLHGYQLTGSKNGRLPISNGLVISSNSDRWARCSLSSDTLSSNGIEAGRSILIDEKTTLESGTQKGSFDVSTLNNSASSNGSCRNEKKSLETAEIHQRLQYLESSLSSALNSVRSKVKDVLSNEIDESSAAKLDDITDDWEFRETEIMKTKDEVRSLRARLSVLEGKMALQIIEAQKLIEENQKKLDEARIVLRGFRDVSVVWSNPASEVLLVGSFDGWTTKRNMEKSREGHFSLNLMLYPGKYEIKFIVDGVWTVDPLRPVVNNNGHENNLLTVV